MADYTLSIALDAAQAIRSSEKLTNALKTVDSATKRLNTSVGASAKVLGQEVSSTLSRVREVTSSLGTSLSQATTKVTDQMGRVTTAVQSVSTSADTLKNEFKTYTSTITSSAKSMDAAFKAADKLQSALTKVSTSAKVSRRDLEALDSASRRFKEAIATAYSTKSAVSSTRARVEDPNLSAASALQKELLALDAQMIGADKAYSSLTRRTGNLMNAHFRLEESILAVQNRLSQMKKSDDGYKELKTALSGYKKELHAVDTVLTKNHGLQEKLRVSIQKLSTEYAEVYAELSRVNNAMQTSRSALSGYDAKLQNLVETESKLIERQARVRKQLENVTAMSFGGKEASNKDSENAILAIGKAARSSLYAINAFRIAFNLAFAASGLRAGTRVVADFDQTLADMRSIMQGSGTDTQTLNYQMDALKRTMEELGATSRYTTAEAGQGMIYMAQAGLSAGEVVAASSHIIDLAVASNTSLARASDIVVQSMRTFNIEASNAWQVTDTLAMGAKASVTSIEQLAQALKFVGPIAHTMGVRIDTVVAALGTLSDSGLQASMAGTGLRRIISEIVNPTFKARKILDSVGLTIEKLDIQGLGLVQVLKNIKDANLSVGDSFAIWGDRGTPALQTIMTNFDEFQKKLKQIDLGTIQGTARDMRATREDTISGQWKASVSAIQEFIIKFSEYLGMIDRAKDSLAWFSTTLREYNTNIAESASSIFKWGSAAVTFFTTYNLLRGGLDGVSGSLTKFTAQIQNNARIFENLKMQVQDGTVSLLPFRSTVDKVTYSLSGVLAKSKAAAVAFRVLAGAATLLANVGVSLAIAAVVAGITKFITATDRSTLAMERLSEFSKYYWKDATTNWASAEQAVKDYGESLISMNNISLGLEKKTLEADIASIQEHLLGFGSNIHGKWTFKYRDIGSLIFGKSTDEIIAEAQEDASSLRELLAKFQNSPELLTKIGMFSPEEAQRIKEYVEALQTLSAGYTKVGIAQKEFANRESDTKFADEAKKRLEEYQKFQSEATAQFAAFGNTLTNRNLKELTTEIEKISNKTRELTTNFGSQEFDSFWNSLQKNIKNFDQFFEIDFNTYTVKVKDALSDALAAFAPETSDDLKNAMLKLLGVDAKSVEDAVKQLNSLGEAYKELRKARLESAKNELALNATIQKNLTATGSTAEKAKDELLKQFSNKELEQFQITFTDTFATLRTAEGEFVDSTQGMAKEITDALQVIYGSLANLKTVKFDSFMKNQAILNAIPKADRQKVTSFANASGLSLADYDVNTGKWKPIGSYTEEQVNAAAKAHAESKPTDSKRITKWEKDIESQIAELGLKYKQYYAEIFTGSDSQVKIKKLEIEQLKEESELLSKAAALGISSSDQRIQSLIAENKRVTDLRIAYEKFQAPIALEEAKGEADLAEAQIHGAEAYSIQIDNLNRKLQNLKDLQKNWSVEGSEQWHNYRQQIADTQRSLEDLKKKLEEIRMSSRIELLMKTGSVTATREAQVADIDRQLKELQNTLYPGMTNEEYEIYNNKRKLLENERHRAADTEPWRAVPETLNQMASQYSEWAMMSNVVSQGFDMMTESVINFITTGKFSFSEFTKQVGTMLIELTTKMMMFKTVASFAGIFADGGMTNIIGFANGGVTNVKKFASGGMLTGPTLFNSSSGLALAGEAGYEHLMPAARLSNGKWGVYAEGMGGNNNQFVINTNINVEGSSSGNAEDDNKLAATISEKVSQSIKDTVKAELVQQMRAGGLLNSNGNKRW